MTRFLPHAVLPKNYNFLTKHSERSFITYTTYNFGAAAFNRTLSIKHNFNGAPLCDMWVAKVASTSGNAITDKPVRWDTIHPSPYNVYTGSGGAQTLDDLYYCYTDSVNINVFIRHNTATSGTYHVYFHIKMYGDSFYDTLYN